MASYDRPYPERREGERGRRASGRWGEARESGERDRFRDRDFYEQRGEYGERFPEDESGRERDERFRDWEQPRELRDPYGSHQREFRGRFEEERFGRRMGGMGERGDPFGSHQREPYGRSGEERFGGFGQREPRDPYGSRESSGWYGDGGDGGRETGSYRGVSAGRYAGRGPKGYQRSDERLREEVCDRLMAAPEIDAGELTVSVKDGEVTLEGSVPERSMKREAEDCAERISGVRQVHNRLRVEPGEGSDRSGSSGAAGGAARYASAAEGQRAGASRKTSL